MSMNAASKYANLESVRRDYVSRAEECAQLTIPSIFIERQQHRNTVSEGELVTPHNSLGARAVRNLGAKLVNTLLPTSTPFFKYIVDDTILDELPEGVNRGDIETRLNRLSRVVNQWMQKSNLRVESVDIFHKLIVTGSPLFFVGEDLRVETFSLDEYVMERDRSGKILQIIIKETFKYASLPEDIRGMVDEVRISGNKKDLEKDVQIYTWVKLNEDGQYESHKEVYNKVLEDTKSVYPKGILPWIAPRMIKIAGEHYGRSYVEEYLGDLRLLEGLSDSLGDMAATASRSLVLVNPSAVTDLDDLNGADNGDFVFGNPNDFNPLTIPVAGDFGVVRALAQDIENRLGQAFLLFSPRDSERTTAEEIRLTAEELNTSLGGIYSVLSEEYQDPLIKIFQWRLSKAKIIRVPTDVDISIVTGVEALGRGQDLGRLNGFLNNLAQLGQAGIDMMSYIKPDELLKRLVSAHGIDEGGLVKSSEELDAEQQQSMAMQAVTQGEGAKALREIAVHQAKQATEVPEEED